MKLIQSRKSGYIHDDVSGYFVTPDLESHSYDWSKGNRPEFWFIRASWQLGRKFGLCKR